MKPMRLLLASAFVAGIAIPAVAEEVTSTVPQGVVTLTIAGSPNGTVYEQTPISVPLLPAVDIVGQAAGKITGTGTNTISNSQAGWGSTSALAQAGAPFFVNIKSGTAEGRMFQILSHTDNTLTVRNQGLDISSLGIVTSGTSADTYEIVPGFTVLSLFGNPDEDGVIGGTFADLNAFRIDKVVVNDPSNNAAFTCYFDTDAGHWKRPGSAANLNNLAISPKMGAYYMRISTTPLTYEFLGYVPVTDSKHQVDDSGTTLLSTYFPKPTTLGALGLQDIPSWRKVGHPGVLAANSDRVILKVGPSFLTYYFDLAANQWRRPGSNGNQGNVSVPIGGVIRVVRSGTARVSNSWTRELPYDPFAPSL